MLRDLAPIILAVIGAGGLAGGVVALLKLRPEAGQITVVAAQGALVVQKGVLDTLLEENTRMHEENNRILTRLRLLEEEAGITRGLRIRIEGLERERDLLREENGSLHARLEVMDNENDILKTRVGHLERELEGVKDANGNGTS